MHKSLNQPSIVNLVANKFLAGIKRFWIPTSGWSLIGALLTVLVSAAGPLSAQTTQCSNIIVFGDSMSDNGNMFRRDTDFAELTDDRPYNNGRISNRLLMVEHLAQSLGLELEPDEEKGLNFALVGARAANRGSLTIKQLRLSRQIDSWEPDNSADGKDLFVFTIGLNDVMDTLESDTEIAKQNVQRAVDSVNAGVSRLIRLGARHFIVVNVPNAANLPEVINMAASLDTDDRTALLERARADSELFNETLNDRLTAIVETHNNIKPNSTSDDVNLTLFDLFRLSNQLRANPDEFGFNEKLASCFTHDENSEIVFDEDCDATNEKIDKFIYFDPRHPTNAYHETIFNEINETWSDCVNDGGSSTSSSSTSSSSTSSSSTSSSSSSSGSDVPLFNRWAAQRMIDQNPNPSASESGSGSNGGSGSSTGGSQATVTINGVAGVVRHASPAVPADSVSSNPVFNPNYVSDSGQYSGPLWYPL